MHTVKLYICSACGWIYRPEQGDPDSGIAPGTPWEEIPDDWVCPVCGVGKGEFQLVESPRVTIAPQEAAISEPGLASIVVVGSGLAGYSLVKELRRRDAGSAVTMVAADGGELYAKPMLSNALARKQHPDDLVQKEAADMAEELGIEIRARTRVLSIDPDARTLQIEDADGMGSLSYDRLVLALGADPRVFPVEGSEAVGIFTVNDLDDYRRWRERIGRDGRILLIGAGLIGCEFANDLAAAGFGVAVVDPAPWPLARLLPKEIGDMLVGALRKAGCILHMGRTVVHYDTTDSGYLGMLDDGTAVPFDHVLSAVGLSPRTGLAREAGLRVQAGILVDHLLRTSNPFIFALGDCSETQVGPLPFIAPLLAQARALAATLTGNETRLRLPAMPAVVKTPVLPLVVCPPPAGLEGGWELDLGDNEAVAVFRTPAGIEQGFVLAGAKTAQQLAMAKRMPDLLPDVTAEPAPVLMDADRSDAGAT